MKIGDHDQKDLDNLSKSWITTPAAKGVSSTFTLTDSGATGSMQAFLDVNVTGTAKVAQETGAGDPFTDSGASGAMGPTGLEVAVAGMMALLVALPMGLL